MILAIYGIVAFTWPNLCLWIAILCLEFVSYNKKKLKTLKPKAYFLVKN